MRYIKTLKELKADFPDKVKTKGNIYHIEGFGQFRQRETVFGIETFWKNDNDEWSRTNFESLVKDMRRIFRGV